MASKTNLPSVVSEVPRDLRDWINRVRETLERAEDSQGAASTTTVINYYGPGGGGGGGGTPWQPGDPLPCGNPVSPPAPTGLTVDAGFGFFLLTWDMPTYCGHSYTEVWGLRNDDLGAAVLLGSSIGQTFSYVVNEQNAYWCFWIRHVNLLGQVGPYNQTGGVCAQTALDPGYLLDLLKGRITESQLYRDLGERINLIEPLKTQIESEKRIRENEDGIVAQRVDTVWAVADDAKAGVTDITTSRIGYCGKRAKGTTGAWTTTEYADKVACLATHADSGTYDYQWFVGLPWASAVKQVSVTVPDKCYLDGQLQDGYTKTTCEAATGTDGKKGVWITGTTGALEQAFNATADELGKLSLQYTVKIDAGGHIAGFGLSSEPTAEGPNTSRFIVRADEFAICGATTVSATAPANPYKGQAWLNSTTNVVSYWTGSAWSTDSINASIPFVVVTNSPTVGGEVVPPGVYMDAAFIKNGTITSAKIGNAAITNAKILNLTASKIVSGTIAVDTYIQTSNYVPASTGWKLWTDASGAGYAEFNGGANGAAVTVRGTLYADRGWFKGCLLGGGASEFELGTGFFAGWADANGQCVNPGTTGAVYKWRVGTPGNQRMTWDGTTLRVYDGANNELLRYGTSESWLRVLDAVNPAIERVRVGTLANGSKGIEIRDASNNVVLNSGGLLGGGSANLLNNSDFSQAVSGSYGGISTPCEPWVVSYRTSTSLGCALSRVTSPPSLNVALSNASSGAYAQISHLGSDARKAIAVTPGGRYEGSVYVGVTNAYAQLWVQWFNSSNISISQDLITASGIPVKPITSDYTQWGYAGGFVTAPANATQAIIFVRVVHYSSATSSSTARFTRVYFGSATANQQALTPWSANTGGPIGPNTIGTYMSNAAIDTAYIKDAAVDTLKIAGNAVTIPQVLTGTSGSFTFNAPVAMPVIVVMSLDTRPSTTNSQPATMEVVVSGATYAQVELTQTAIQINGWYGDGPVTSYAYPPTTKAFKINVNAGSNTFTLRKKSTSFFATDTTVAIIGAAR